jgi:hypothetical protein
MRSRSFVAVLLAASAVLAGCSSAHKAIDQNSIRTGLVLAPPPRSISIGDVSSSLGTPVALPNQSGARSASAGRVCPLASVEGIDGTCEVIVNTHSRSVTIVYRRPTGKPDSKAGFEEVARQVKKEVARHPGSGTAEVLDLNGVPAFFATGDYSAGTHGSPSVEFILGDTAFTIYGRRRKATLLAIADLILRQTPRPAELSLSDASTTLGAPIVLPKTQLVQPSDAARLASVACRPEGTAATPCQVTVGFPSLKVHYVPLTIRYLRPVRANLAASYNDVIRQIKGAKFISIAGEQALFVPRLQGAYPGWLEFVAGGTDVTAQGNYDEATLRAIAESILTQAVASQAAPRQPAGTGIPSAG